MSAFAYSEFQAVQFMPAIVMPQVLLCGLIAPREQMAGAGARRDPRGHRPAARVRTHRGDRC